MKEKVLRRTSGEVQYDPEHWSLLADLRERAFRVGSVLPGPVRGYGSLARGDIHPGSDVDLLVDPMTSFVIEIALEHAGFQVQERVLVQATPNVTPKAHWGLGDETVVSMPLLGPTERELEFYRFAGALEISDARSFRNGKLRVPGVSKQLVLVEPNATGHHETSIVDEQVQVQKVLAVGAAIVEERFRVLERRDRVGRTGVYLKEYLDDDETFEQRLRWLGDRDPVVRRLLERRGGR